MATWALIGVPDLT